MANDERVLRARLTLLEGYIRDLHDLQDVDFETYVSNFLIHRAVERTLHLALEACIDMGQHIIAVAGYRQPNDYQDVFVVLGEEAVVPRSLLPRLQSMARFRNLIVHDYAQIDNEIVFGILQQRLGDFSEFAHAVAAYVEDG